MFHVYLGNHKGGAYFGRGQAADPKIDVIYTPWLQGWACIYILICKRKHGEFDMYQVPGSTQVAPYCSRE